MKLSINDILKQEDIDYVDHIELENKKLKAKIEVAMNLINAVAHVGIDFGYGKYELTPEIIAEARMLSEIHTATTKPVTQK